MKKIVIIDNYDSFTYNLAHYFEDLNCEVTVYKNDEFEMEELLHFDKIVLSPGPGIPKDAGLLFDVIKAYYSKKSILGICLGQQAIAEFFGASLLNLKTVFHGIATPIKITVSDEVLFNGLDQQFNAGRYHSWVVNPVDFPETLEITSQDNIGNIMSLRHMQYDICGVQFHPESILTPDGKKILENWVNS
jgi:anthranilate synthase component 2